jgi:hypothetical protein
MRRRVAALGAGAALVAAGAGCESTQEKSERLSKRGSQAFTEKGLRITEVSREVRVGAAQVLDDREQQVTAAVVELENRSNRVLVNVPVAIDVRDRRGRSLFRNNAPGIEPSLVGPAVLEPRRRVAWVNDQVVVAGAPSAVRVKVGATSQPPPAELPELDVTPPRISGDPVSGVAATGVVTNESGILQRKLVVYGVVRRGGRVVAAGRSGIERLRPGRRAPYKIFFVGDPRGGRVELFVPPTTFK